MMTVNAYAKINLDLRVFGKRPDGYHEIATTMQALALSDILTVDLTDKPGITFAVDQDGIPAGPDNLAYRAAEIMLAGMPESKRPGVSVTLEKRIPMAAGLAGGSSDAAAVLAALNRLLERNASPDALCALGRTLGADVPYCVAVNSGACTRALCTGIGDVIEPLQREPEDVFVLLAKPRAALSTPEVYRIYDEKNFPEQKNALEPAAKSLCSEIGRIEELLQELGHAETVQMSGSGPTVFSLYRSKDLLLQDKERLEKQWNMRFAEPLTLIGTRYK